MADKLDIPADDPKSAAAGDRGPKPPRGTPWRHQDGCMNPDSDDWNCPCRPEVIKE